MTKQVSVTRVLKSTKVFEVEVTPGQEIYEADIKNDAIEQACQEEVIEECINGWTENLDWEAKIL
jgi:hypothetical protein